MHRIKELLQLKYECALSFERIARALKISKSAPQMPSGTTASRAGLLAYVHLELKRNGVTLALLWEEYRQAQGEAIVPVHDKEAGLSLQIPHSGGGGLAPNNRVTRMPTSPSPACRRQWPGGLTGGHRGDRASRRGVFVRAHGALGAHGLEFPRCRTTFPTPEYRADVT